MKLFEDLKCFSNNNKKKMITTILVNPCFHCVLLYRISRFFYKIHLTPISKIIWYINRILFHVDIDFHADLAGGFVLVHGLGVVIGAGVVSEGPLKVYQGVTLGGRNFSRDINGKKMFFPYIKPNVIIYTDAKIFGAVIIGENSIVKAGEIVTKDVFDH